MPLLYTLYSVADDSSPPEKVKITPDAHSLLSPISENTFIFLKKMHPDNVERSDSATAAAAEAASPADDAPPPSYEFAVVLPDSVDGEGRQRHRKLFSALYCKW